MDDRERLLRVTEEFDVPVQVSAADGATRHAAEQAETDGAAAAKGSCGMTWSGWGN